jgi:hypothetical protein
MSLFSRVRGHSDVGWYVVFHEQYAGCPLVLLPLAVKKAAYWPTVTSVASMLYASTVTGFRTQVPFAAQVPPAEHDAPAGAGAMSQVWLAVQTERAHELALGAGQSGAVAHA